MLRPFVARWLLLLLLLVVAVLLWMEPRRIQAASLALQAATAPGRQPPLGAVAATPAAPLSETVVNVPQQRRVKVNFFINSISNVNDQTNAYDVDFYLDFYWHEPALEGKNLDEVDKANLWDPHPLLINSPNITTVTRVYLNSLEPDTNVHLSYRLRGTFVNRFDLHKFPFDQQVLTLRLESTNFDSSLLLFDFIGIDKPIVYSDQPFEQPIPKGKYIASDFALEEWTIDDAKAIEQIHVLAYDRTSWAQFRVDLLVTRNYASYFWKIILELMFLLLMVWGVLFLDSQELRYRLLLLFTLLLATVIFSFMLLQILPKVSYVTFLDLAVLLCYGAIGVMTVVVSLVKFLYETKRVVWAVRLNRFALRLYPVFWVGAILLLFWYVTH